MIAPAFVLQIKQLPAAAFASAVGMWATRLRCPSEAAYPQSSPPRSYPCRHAMPPWETDCSLPDADGDDCKNSSIIRCRLALRARQGFQMHFLVFDRAPQPFDENIVHETTASVHRNRDAGGLEPTGEGRAGELQALIGVEYFWRAVPRQRFVERRDAKARIHRVRQAPRQNRPAGPVDNCH